MARLIIVLGCFVLVLLPWRAHAAPRENLLGCALSVPDQSLSERMERANYVQETINLTIDELPISIHMCAPAGEANTAARMLQLIGQALPLLGTQAGLKYDGPRDRWVLLVPEEDMPEHVQGIYYDQNSIIKLNRNSPDWAVVHEAAHYYANDRNFTNDEPWMSEGFAEYLTERVMVDLKRPFQRTSPPTACVSLPLQQWSYYLNDERIRCSYDVGRAVFRDLNYQVGDAIFRAVIGRLGDTNVVASPTLLDELERASGLDLAPLMQHRVFPENMDDVLEQRRQAWQALRAARTAAQPDLPLPPWLDYELHQWHFAPVLTWLGTNLPLLEGAREYATLCQQAVLACPPLVQTLPDASEASARLLTQVQDAVTLMGRYTALAKQARALGLEPPHTLADAAIALRSEIIPQIDGATATLERGAALERTCAELAAPCSDGWRTAWSSGDFARADATLVELRGLLEHARPIDMQCAGAAQSFCRAQWHPALQHGDLQAAHRALDTLQTFLAEAVRAEQQCADARTTCHQFWQAALEDGGLSAGQAALRDLAQLLNETQALEQRCQAAGWPCARFWRSVFAATRDTSKTRAHITYLSAQLPTLQQAHTALRTPDDFFKQIVAAQSLDARIGSAASIRQALDQGDDRAAVALAGEIVARENQIERLRIGTGGGLLGLAGVLVLLIWRMHRRQRPPVPPQSPTHQRQAA